MHGEVWVMVIFAIGILVGLAVSLLTLVLRQVREGDIRWWVPPGARAPRNEEPREERAEQADEVKADGARGRSRR
ncbi:hypothetical protein GCM10010116_18030 [Microbispora rosea subsp. aerata]|nr:hypothetical protein GCM10010116_18030 [Microbispora rosea subsp. aerata]GIH55314.1 hypothetical protein Mro02_22280 [Microbispora rosea subsp. aerata]GLJ86589.1 hypothetical protein GCM10017588_53270 [Microbispora rosea subsp. aerata]